MQLKGSATMDLRSLLLHAINDAAVYSALVPWVLAANSSVHQALPLDKHTEQRQVLQQYQLQQAGARPRAMCQCVLQLVQQSCCHARSLNSGSCPTSEQQGAGVCSSCSLSLPATRLAKLHGHILAHGLAPNLAEQLQMLVMMLIEGPLPASSSMGSPSSNLSMPSTGNKQLLTAKKTSSLQKGGKLQQQTAGATSTPVAAAAVSTSKVVSCAEELLTCKSCAARYAAKALECCSKLLCCMPFELLRSLAASPHAQFYAPSLAALLQKAAAATSTMTHSNSAAAASSHQLCLQQQQQGVTPVGTVPRSCSPAAAAAACAGQAASNSNLAAPSSGGPGSAGGKSSAARACGSSKLSGLGLLMPNTPTGSAGKPPSAGPAGRGATATLNNREKSRDMFFSILRRCSSRLEALRQQQAAAASLEAPQQQTAAAAVFDTELQELIADVGLAAKQLLLQLAPGNLLYLAELFTACVLQAASGGEPILEPQLALMAEKDPHKFQKLQQRLLDRPGSARAQPPPQQQQRQCQQQTANQATAAGSAEKGRAHSSSGTAGAGTHSKIGSSSAVGTAASRRMHSSIVSESVQQPRQQQQLLGPVLDSTVNLQPAGPATSGTPHSGAGSHQLQHRLTQQQHIMAALPAGSHSHDNARLVASAPRSSQSKGPQQHTPNSGNSTGSSFRLAAAAGMSTPLPFAANGSVAACTPGCLASPTVAASGPPAVWARPWDTSQPQQAGRGGSTEKARSSQQQQQTPASAPPTVPVEAAAAARIVGPGRFALITEKGSQASSSTSSQIVLQLLSELPAGQHMLLLVLHAADSSSFNRSLLNVMLDRAEKLLTSCPASLTAAGGLGQQASAALALAGYCSYLSFVAGCADEPQVQHQQHVTAAADASDKSSRHSSSMDPAGPLLQQQPVVDVASLLEKVMTSDTSNSSSTAAAAAAMDRSWCLALAIPFVCRYLRFASFNPSAAASQCVACVLQHLQQLQELPCMAPSHSSYGSLPAALSSCLQSCQLLQQQQQQQGSSGLVWLPAGRHGVIGDKVSDASAAAELIDRDWLSGVLGQGSCLVDSAYWSICCPGLQQLSCTLAAAAAAVQRPQQQQPLKVTAIAVSKAVGGASGAGVSPVPQPKHAPAKQQPADGAAPTAADATPTGPSSTTLAASHADSSAGSSPASTGAALRHTTPLLLAPRAPPVLDAPPACIQEALAEVNDPLKQQLQQAFIGQYSTDDMPVKMRDVLALVNGILCANSWAHGLSKGVPGVLQQHLADMEQQVKQQLSPSTAGPGAQMQAPLEGQELARAVHQICTEHSAPAVHAALESAMQQAAAHANQAAISALAALLPAEVPSAAVSAAAALVAASCKASCAQRLLQEVPQLVQATLANQADELVRLVNRQWAVHCRLTAAPPAPPAAPPAAASGTDGSQADQLAPGGAPAAVCSRPVRRQVNLVQPGVSAASLVPEAIATVTTSNGGSSRSNRGTRRIDPVPVIPVAAVSGEAGDNGKVADGCSGAHAGPGGVAARGNDNASSNGIGKDSRGEAAQAAQQADQQAEPGTADIGLKTATTELHNSASIGAAAGLKVEATAQQVMPRCKTRLAQEGVVSAGLLQELQADLVAAVSQRDLQLAVEKYFAAVVQLLPALEHGRHTAAQGIDQTGQLPQLAASSDGAQGVAWRAVVAAAEVAAAVLVAGVAAGAYALSVLEQQLLALLEAGVVLPTAAQPEAAGDHNVLSFQVHQGLGQLLCGAVLHAFLNSTEQQAAVWAAPMQRAAPGPLTAADASSSMPHFTSLPARLMKAVRGDGPEWLLSQLRVWLQGATLGHQHLQ